MKNYITPPYTFTPGVAGSGVIKTYITNFNIKLLVGIVNITRGTVIYWPSMTGMGYTGISGDQITLEVDTSTHDSSDQLQIIYDSTADYPVFAQVTNFPTSAPLPSGAATEATLDSIDSVIGNASDVAAITDTGSFSIMAFIKRAMQNWTTLLGRIPVSVSGRVPVDGSGVVQPVSGPLTSSQLAVAELTEAMRQAQMELEVLKNTIGQTRVDSAGRLRILLDSISASLTLATITTVGTVTTVSTVTNQAQIGGVNANDQVNAMRRLAADTILSKITIS